MQPGKCSANHPVSCNNLGTNPVNPEPREIIRLLAEKVMGWNVEIDSCDPEYVRAQDWREWNPLTSIADAYEMEGRIPDGLRDDYIGYLECICVPGREFSYDYSLDHRWAIRRATPEQMCRAAVAALKAGGGKCSTE